MKDCSLHLTTYNFSSFITFYRKTNDIGFGSDTYITNYKVVVLYSPNVDTLYFTD